MLFEPGVVSEAEAEQCFSKSMAEIVDSKDSVSRYQRAHQLYKACCKNMQQEKRSEQLEKLKQDKKGIDKKSKPIGNGISMGNESISFLLF